MHRFKLEMTGLCIVILVALMTGCATKGRDEDMPTVDDFVSRIEYDRHEYFVVPLGHLNKVRKPHSLTYVGTVDAYHLLRVWSKIVSQEGEMHYFAIDRAACHVDGEAVPDDEKEYVTNVFRQWRHVAWDDGKCSVPPRRTASGLEDNKLQGRRIQF